MAETSNPRMKITVELDCGCARNFEMRYQDPRPGIGDETECDAHGVTWVQSFTAVGA